MIGTLIFEAPHVWKLIRDQLIGNDGVPDSSGDAAGGFVKKTEVKNNAAPGDYWYRFFRPNDPMINITASGAAQDYYALFETGVAEEILASTFVMTVPTGEAVAIFGIICNLDLGRAGYIHILKENVVKVEVPARIAWRQQNPPHYYVDLDTVIFGTENARINFRVHNGTPSDMTGIVIPIMFRIATRAALNLEKPPKIG